MVWMAFRSDSFQRVLGDILLLLRPSRCLGAIIGASLWIRALGISGEGSVLQISLHSWAERCFALTFCRAWMPTIHGLEQFFLLAMQSIGHAKGWGWGRSSSFFCSGALLVTLAVVACASLMDAGEHLIESGNLLLGRPNLFRVDMPAFSRQVEAALIPAERLAYGCLAQGWVDSRKLQELLHLLPAKGQTRNTTRQAEALDINEYAPRSFAVGAYAHGPHYGLMRNTKAFPYTTLLLTSLIQRASDCPFFSSVTTLYNCLAGLRKDGNNMPGVMNTLIPITTFSGGEVFVQDGCGQDQLLPYEIRGTKIPVVAPFVLVDGSLPHATCGWRGVAIGC